MNKFKKYLIFAVILAVLGVAWLVFLQFENKFAATPLPPALLYNDTSSALQTVEPIVMEPETTLPAEVNLDIPFTSQAPEQNWSFPYKEFCEEASALMVSSYINNQPILSASDADTRLLAIRDFEMKKFGFYEDTNAAETAIIFKEHFNIAKVAIVANPTIIDIKNALAQGKAVVVPAAGRELGNPYYQQPGPLYHMLVIKGYKKNGDFITNDPGTRRGADFVYKADVIMQAIHDWNGGNVGAGEKVILVVG